MNTMTETSNEAAQARADDAMARMRDNARTFLTTPCDYTLTGYSETPSRNGVSWGGTLRKNGAKVGRVFDAGVGGMVDFEWTSPEHATAFEAEAKTRYGDDYNATDDFANDLATAAQYNRKRSILVIFDDYDLSMGDCYDISPATPLAAVKAALTAPTGRFAGRNPMIWDKSQSMFVPVADIEV